MAGMHAMPSWAWPFFCIVAFLIGVVVNVKGVLPSHGEGSLRRNPVATAGLRPVEATTSLRFGLAGGLADGCHHVFIDAGSNKGVHGRFLFEPKKYPLAVKAIPVFDEQFGHARQQSTCVFAFEPNLLHAEKQNHTQTIYRAMGWRYTYMPMALGAKNSSLTMYRNKDYDNKGIQWSFGYRGVGRNEEAIEVPVLDFADWLERVVFSRRLPEDSPTGWGSPKVVVKMDIEGMEMRVLPRLLTSGALCKIDFIFGEAHYSFNPIEVQGNITLTETRDTVNWIVYLNRFLNASWCSPWHDLDDEDYFEDGLPYPEPPR